MNWQGQESAGSALGPTGSVRCDTQRDSGGHRAVRARVRLDPPPACRKVRIANRQRPHPMHVLRQYHPRANRKRPPRSLRRHTRPQQIDVPHQQVVAATFQQVDREEPRAARRQRPSIIRHRHHPQEPDRQHAHLTRTRQSASPRKKCQKTPTRTAEPARGNPCTRRGPPTWRQRVVRSLGNEPLLMLGPRYRHPAASCGNESSRSEDRISA